MQPFSDMNSKEFNIKKINEIIKTKNIVEAIEDLKELRKEYLERAEHCLNAIEYFIQPQDLSKCKPETAQIIRETRRDNVQFRLRRARECIELAKMTIVKKKKKEMNDKNDGE